ncbi:hypothetical protein GHT06_001545 [Daphnia sinensis]|uniref:Uncharacterized protein n=1 Tax=Daphnia sinensis TaxID=1820382 RepID=A0AAD5L332_9CRUS|nr:hypothetical protein GHT06_001545 [Daphnia sinensis]
MRPRVTKAFAKRRGTRVSRGRGSVQTREENLRQIVGQFPITDAQQELLRSYFFRGGYDDIVDLTEYEMTSTSAEHSPPPDEPIPKFTVESWKAKWRRDFFSDWRWAAKKKGNGHQVNP